MSRTRLRVLAGFALSACALAAQASETSTAPELVVFVGRLVDVVELDDRCGEQCAAFDSGYALTYDVLEDVRGETKAARSRFEFFGHYGLPSFTWFDTALVFVFRGKNQDVMARYLAFPVARTTEGKWAFCGDPYPEDVPKRAKKLQKVEFAQPVQLSAVTAKRREENGDDGGIGRTRAGISRCRNAVSANDLAEFFAPGAEPGYLRVWSF